MRDSQKLFMIKNIEVIDKLTDRQKFSRALMKKEEVVVPNAELRQSNSNFKKNNLKNL